MSLHTGLAKRVTFDLVGAESVVDIGCMHGKWLACAPSGSTCLGVDIHDYSKEFDYSLGIFLRDDALNWITAQADRSWGAVLLLDVIEHLVKPRARSLLSHAQRVANKVIVFTPLGFEEMHYQDSGDPNNPHQEHVSGWEPEDLERFGFRVEHLNEFKTRRIYATWKAPTQPTS